MYIYNPQRNHGFSKWLLGVPQVCTNFIVRNQISLVLTTYFRFFTFKIDSESFVKPAVPLATEV